MSKKIAWILDTIEHNKMQASAGNAPPPLTRYLHHISPFNSEAKLKQMHIECFTGVVKFKDFENHTKIDENVKQLVHALHKFTLPSQNKLEKELDEMVRQGMIA